MKVEQNETRDWPFFYPSWQTIKSRAQYDLYIKAEDESIRRIFNQRCERHRQKKETNLARAQGLLHRGPKVPGAWIG
jgi:hypothetical protein